MVISFYPASAGFFVYILLKKDEKTISYLYYPLPIFTNRKLQVEIRYLL